jgi:hypothetical protein
MYLPTELAKVLGMLRYLHLLDLLTQASTIPGSCNIIICYVNFMSQTDKPENVILLACTIFANNSGLLGALRLHRDYKSKVNYTAAQYNL